ncbi:hypothetical protein A2188_00855 [Candidatus Woesebacteria bacterium RIFOXYA1_FULL_43_9]|uniref:Uncharacterized protein n=1 Tax=Candidatus Woesebacteria bacterium RIFOXYA1_FULL_43_9 TaxID=1802534 RepID=A0A1F8CQ03_9BACT|nr:MAG: hypothetical protein A2188_00855 [Candidatus Woesebacteria bacterium RIFOXYA1_FULL_43_9]
MTVEAPDPEIVPDENLSEERSDFETIRNRLLKPFAGEGVYNKKPPDWISLLKDTGEHYRTKMARALIDRIPHDGD